jgi:putative PIN family toxin of toxin-antitoxin system
VKRVVADSNVLVSALQFGGKPMALLMLAEDGQIDLAISEAILDETLGVLKVKFQNTPEQLADREAYVRAITSIVVAPSETVAVIHADPTDDRILECAIAADAEVIVSGDRHLLALGNFRGIGIQKPADFLAGFQARPR